jgi:chromosome partitioning protein
MKIISAIQPKGGSGKSTLLYGLSKMFHDRGAKVLVLDPDTNMSLSKAYERRIDFMEGRKGLSLDFPTVRSFQPSATKLERQLQDFGHEYDIVMVDTFGTIQRFHNDLIYASDLVLIPAQPAQAAIDNALATCDYLDTVRAENDNLPVYGVTLLNFTRNGVEDRQYRRDFDEAFVFSVETRHYRKAYKMADQLGLSVTELDKVGLLSKQDAAQCINAAIDMRRLCNEIIDLVETL